MTYTPHFNQAGEAHMVDVGEKAITHRTAVTEGFIEMKPATLPVNIKKGMCWQSQELPVLWPVKKQRNWCLCVIRCR